MRRRSKLIKIGSIKIGAGNPIAIQGMTKTKTVDVRLTIKEIKDLEKCGADIVRLAIDDLKAAEAFRKIRKAVTKVPLVADIHFDYRLALKSLEYGVDKIRLNPGNLNKPEEVKAVVKLAKKLRKPIRVGVNSGSVGRITGLSNVESMVKAALSYVKILEKLDFKNTVISLKSSDIRETIEANRTIATKCDYPLHLGVTATGIGQEAIIKSSIGIGAMLLNGIGDTIRISLTADAREEIQAAKNVLKALGLYKNKYEIISCPTCGRCSVDLKKIVTEMEKMLQTKGLMGYNKKIPYKIAIMGCVVNGPGEAKEADFGVAFSKVKAAIFRKGKIVRTVGIRSAKTVFSRFLKEELK